MISKISSDLIDTFIDECKKKIIYKNYNVTY